MEQKRTLFGYLYHNLKEQILTGYLSYGDPLPSLNQICETYHVGKRTARDVMQALKEEHLVQAQERRPTLVIYRRPETFTDADAFRMVLEQRTSIRQIYETITILMPSLIAFSYLVCNEEIRFYCFEPFIKHRGKHQGQRWKLASGSIHSLLDASGNLLFRDIFTSLEQRAIIPLIECRDQVSFLDSCRSYDNPSWMIDTLNTQDANEIALRFRTMYDTLAQGVEAYLNDVSSRFHIAPLPEDANYFTWYPECGRDHYYMQIARTLIDQIGLGMYSDGEYLPTEAVLAVQYNVSLSTVRRAMAILNTTGFGHTYNAKGTQVTLFNDYATMRCMKNKVFKQDTLFYLSGLQFIAIAIRPAVALAFERISAEYKSRLRQSLQEPFVVPLDLITQCVIDHIPLLPFRTILQEVKNTLRWGYYYSFFSNGILQEKTLHQLCAQAYDYLWAGAREPFANQIYLCYCHVLAYVRDFLVDCGLPEAKRLVTPVPEQFDARILPAL